MKSSYIIALVLIIIIGGITLFNTQKEVLAPIPTVTDGQQEPVGTPDATEMGMTAEEHAAMMETESETGTNVGMEFPKTDITQDSMVTRIDPNEKVFEISGENFAFSQKEIRVKEGDTVTINFTSANGFHDFVVDEFNARTNQVKAGEASSVTFVADKTGTFEYYCSIGSHRANGMVGKLVVE